MICGSPLTSALIPFHQRSTQAPSSPPGRMLAAAPGTSADSLLRLPQISGDEFYSDVAKGTLQYVARNLSHRVSVR